METHLIVIAPEIADLSSLAYLFSYSVVSHFAFPPSDFIPARVSTVELGARNEDRNG